MAQWRKAKARISVNENGENVAAITAARRWLFARVAAQLAKKPGGAGIGINIC